jgi:hypothetical protein
VRQPDGEFPVVECIKADGGGCILSPVCKAEGGREGSAGRLAVFADLVANRAELVVLVETTELNCDPPGEAT